MNKCDAEIYLKNFKRIFDVTTKNIYFHIDNYGKSTQYFSFENNLPLYSYYEIKRDYLDDNHRITSLNLIFGEIIYKLPKEEYIAYIISIRSIYSFNGTNRIILALAQKALK